MAISQIHKHIACSRELHKFYVPSEVMGKMRRYTSRTFSVEQFNRKAFEHAKLKIKNSRKMSSTGDERECVRETGIPAPTFSHQ